MLLDKCAVHFVIRPCLQVIASTGCCLKHVLFELQAHSLCMSQENKPHT